MKYPRSPSRHDGLAVTAFVLAWVIPLAGLILGIVSVASSHRENRKASGLAISGIVIGAVATVATAAVIITLLAAAGAAAPPAIPTSPGCGISNPAYPYC